MLRRWINNVVGSLNSSKCVYSEQFKAYFEFNIVIVVFNLNTRASMLQLLMVLLVE
jgi:hypothetical protein